MKLWSFLNLKKRFQMEPILSKEQQQLLQANYYLDMAIELYKEAENAGKNPEVDWRCLDAVRKSHYGTDRITSKNITDSFPVNQAFEEKTEGLGTSEDTSTETDNFVNKQKNRSDFEEFDNITKTETPDQKEANKSVEELESGDFYFFGSYPQCMNGEREPILWRVLQKAGDEIILLSDKILDSRPYQSSAYGNVDSWETSDLREWLNDTFWQEAFSTSEKSRVKLKRYHTSPNPERTEKDPDSECDSQEYVTLLDIGELFQCFSDADNTISEQRGCFNYDLSGDATAKPTAYAIKHGIDYNEYDGFAKWWLRNSGITNKQAILVDSYGMVSVMGEDNNQLDIGIRPLISLKVIPNEE